MDLSKTFERELSFDSDDASSLHISQCHVGDVGCVVWDAALCLIYYMETEHFSTSVRAAFPQKELKDLNALELGSGTGAVGLELGRKGIPTTITDLPQFVPLMNMNITNNADCLKAPVKVSPLIWGEDSHPTVDILLISDCLYYEESIEPLLKSIEDLTNPSSLIIMSYEDRSDTGKAPVQNKFFESAGRFLSWSPLDPSALHPDFRCPEIHVLHMRRRQDTAAADL